MSELKKDELKKEELKNEELKNEELKKEELKNEELKKEELKKEELKKEELKNELATGVVTDCLALAVRGEADPSGGILEIAHNKDELTVNIEKSSSSFYQVTTKSGMIGYCMKAFVRIK